MPARREYDHIGGFNFKVEIDNVTQGAFKAVDGLEVETEIIEFQDGDDRTLRKRPGRTKFSDVTLKRGIVENRELWDWFEEIQAGKHERKSVSIVLCDDSGDEVMRYDLFEAWPCKWKGFSLDGKGTDVAVEEISFVIEGMKRTP
jgi:phage tail-like protein